MSVFRTISCCARYLSSARSSLVTSAEFTVASNINAGPRSFSCLANRDLRMSSTRGALGASWKSVNLVPTKRLVQTKSDQEMSDFLSTEIQSEKESLKATGKAVLVKGFEVQTQEAEVILTKKFQDEVIKVTVNVNHAVDAETAEDQDEPSAPPADPAKMVCRPDFHVEISKGGSTLAFNCSMTNESEDEPNLRDADEDLFNVEEFSIYKGEYKESTYVIAGEVMDGSFYDNLMNMLDERGINSEFVQQVIDFCTLYEQKLYVNLLEDLQDVVKSK